MVSFYIQQFLPSIPLFNSNLIIITICHFLKGIVTDNSDAIRLLIYLEDIYRCVKFFIKQKHFRLTSAVFLWLLNQCITDRDVMWFSVLK